MADDQENPDERPVEPAKPAAPAEPGPPAPASGAAPTPGFFDGPDMGALAKGLAPMKAAETAAMDRVRGETIGQAERDMGVARHAFNATSYSPNDLKPWNQQEQSRKYATDPIQAFGSAGSLFAMVASAFTHAPMEVALNGAAAAMNATRAADETEYNRAFASWKDNTNLAIKRHQMEREHYQDAIELMKTNMGVGRAKMEAIAASYNDQKTLFLLRNGMDGELFDLMKSRASAETSMVDAKEKIEAHGFGYAMMVNDPLFKVTSDQEPDPFKLAAYKLHAYQKAFGKVGSVESQIIGQYIFDGIKEGKERTGEELAEFRNKNFGWGSRPLSPEQEQTKLVTEALEKGEITTEEAAKRLEKIQANRRGAAAASATKNAEIERRKQAYMAEGKSEKEAYDLAAKEVQTANAAPKSPAAVTTDRLRAKAIADDTDSLMKPKEEGGEGLSYAEAHRRAETKNPAPMTGAQAQKVADTKQKVVKISNQIDRVRQLIDEESKKGHTLVGIPGKAGTVWEFVDRSTGKRTPHSEFTQLIRIIQSESLPLLTGTTRLTKLGESVRDEMIPGLGYLRDTTQVNHAMETLRKVLNGEDLLTGAEPGKKPGESSTPSSRQTWTPPARDRPVTQSAGP